VKSKQALQHKIDKATCKEALERITNGDSWNLFRGCQCAIEWLHDLWGFSLWSTAQWSLWKATEQQEEMLLHGGDLVWVPGNLLA